MEGEIISGTLVQSGKWFFENYSSTEYDDERCKAISTIWHTLSSKYNVKPEDCCIVSCLQARYFKAEDIVFTLMERKEPIIIIRDIKKVNKLHIGIILLNTKNSKCPREQDNISDGNTAEYLDVLLNYKISSKRIRRGHISKISHTKYTRDFGGLCKGLLYPIAFFAEQNVVP